MKILITVVSGAEGNSMSSAGSGSETDILEVEAGQEANVASLVKKKIMELQYRLASGGRGHWRCQSVSHCVLP